MEHENLSTCPKCGRRAQVADAAFCAYCGAAMVQKMAAPTPEGAQALLNEADRQKTPEKKYKILKEAQARYPDCLAVAEALLFLGRLYERDPRKLDFSVIKCHLWHAYLTPEEFSGEQAAAMRAEMFEHPDLKRCLELAPDADAFTRAYLQRLAKEFIQLFLRGSNRYMRSYFGFRMGSSAAKMLAPPVAAMLVNINGDELLSRERRNMLSCALYRAFELDMGGEIQWLDAELQKAGLSIPADA